MIYIGIDPQPDNISWCILNDELKVLHWYKMCLYKRNSFLTASEYQRYIIEQCTCIVRKHLQLYSEQCNVMIGVEQQRGRINSIIEQTLLTLFYTLFHSKCKIVSMHPKRWKRLVLFEKKGESNKINKVHSVELVKPILDKYCEEHHHEVPQRRIHDLTDAYLISKSLLIENK